MVMVKIKVSVRLTAFLVPEGNVREEGVLSEEIGVFHF